MGLTDLRVPRVRVRRIGCRSGPGAGPSGAGPDKLGRVGAKRSRLSSGRGEALRSLPRSCGVLGPRYTGSGCRYASDPEDSGASSRRRWVKRVWAGSNAFSGVPRTSAVFESKFFRDVLCLVRRPQQSRALCLTKGPVLPHTSAPTPLYQVSFYQVSFSPSKPLQKPLLVTGSPSPPTSRGTHTTTGSV